MAWSRNGLALGLACSALAGSLPACRDRARPFPDAHAPTSCETARLRFRRYELAAAGLSFDALEGPEVRFDPDASPGAVPPPPDDHQGWVIQSTPEVTLALRYGPDATLSDWRDAATTADTSPILFEPEVTTAVCGHAARRQQYTDPGWVEEFNRPPQPVPLPDGATALAPPLRRAPVPPTVHVAISFEHRGTPVLATWSAPSANVAHLRCVEEHFLRGLVCR